MTESNQDVCQLANRETVLHPYAGILFTDKNKWAIKALKDMGNLKCIVLSERSHSEKAINCEIPVIWQSGKEQI